MRHQSMAKRKQTTASPEKIPMNTDRIRKKRSSRNTDRNKAGEDGAVGETADARGPFSSTGPAGFESDWVSTLFTNSLRAGLRSEAVRDRSPSEGRIQRWFAVRW